MACLLWAVHRVGYWIRPYDMLADRRRWFWQPAACCGIPNIDWDAPDIVRLLDKFHADNVKLHRALTHITDLEDGAMPTFLPTFGPATMPERFGVITMSLHFDDADPVATCGECGWHAHGDAINDAVFAWAKHLTSSPKCREAL